MSAFVEFLKCFLEDEEGESTYQARTVPWHARTLCDVPEESAHTFGTRAGEEMIIFAAFAFVGLISFLGASITLMIVDVEEE